MTNGNGFLGRMGLRAGVGREKARALNAWGRSLALLGVVLAACGEPAVDDAGSSETLGKVQEAVVDQNAALAPGEVRGARTRALTFWAWNHADPIASSELVPVPEVASGGGRIFNSTAYPAGTYWIATKHSPNQGEWVTHLIKSKAPPPGGLSDGNSLWLTHSQFIPTGQVGPGGAVASDPPGLVNGEGFVTPGPNGGALSTPVVSSPSSGANGTRHNWTSGPADTGAAVRVRDANLMRIPFVTNRIIRQSFLTQAAIYVPSHPERVGGTGVGNAVRYLLFLQRGSVNLASGGTTPAVPIDFSNALDQWKWLHIRTDVTTSGGTLEDSSDDWARVKYRIYLDGELVSTQEPTLDASVLQGQIGPVTSGPGFAVLRGWQGDAPEAFIDAFDNYVIAPPTPLVAGESAGPTLWTETFGTPGDGTGASLSASKFVPLDSNPDRSVRLFDPGATQMSGTTVIAYRGSGATPARITQHYGHYAPGAACSTNSTTPDCRLPGGGTFDGTAMWVSHSRFVPANGSVGPPPIGSDSPPAVGRRTDGTDAAADVRAYVRPKDEHLIRIPFNDGKSERQSYLISADVYVPYHVGGHEWVRVAPFARRGTHVEPAESAFEIGLLGLTNRWFRMTVRADVTTHAGGPGTADDKADVLLHYAYDGTSINWAPFGGAYLNLDNIAKLGTGDLEFGVSYGVALGWQLDALETFIDNVSVQPIGQGHALCSIDTDCPIGQICTDESSRVGLPSGTRFCWDMACGTASSSMCGSTSSPCGLCPSGSPCTSNVNCESGTSCAGGVCTCPASCDGKPCGASDGCGKTCYCGVGQESCTSATPCEPGFVCEAPGCLHAASVNAPLRPGEVRVKEWQRYMGNGGADAWDLPPTWFVNHNAFGSGINVRYSGNSTAGYRIAYKNHVSRGELVSEHLVPSPPSPALPVPYGSYGNAALWLGHSRFDASSVPGLNQESPAQTGVPWRGGPAVSADTGSAVRFNDLTSPRVPVVTNQTNVRSYVITSSIYVPSHAGVRYGVRVAPYLARGGAPLTTLGGVTARSVDFTNKTGAWRVLQVRADVSTHGGATDGPADDSARATYRYYLDGVEIGTAETADISVSTLTTHTGPVLLSPSLGLRRGWEGDAPEAYIATWTISELGHGARLAANETLGAPLYTLTFNETPESSSLAGTGILDHGFHGHSGTSLRLFDGRNTQRGGRYITVYKNSPQAGEWITNHFRTLVPSEDTLLKNGTLFDGTAMWLGHSRFLPFGEVVTASPLVMSVGPPAIGVQSAPATGTRWNGTVGPAEWNGADARVTDVLMDLATVPFTAGVTTQKSFLISMDAFVPKHAGAHAHNHLEVPPAVMRGPNNYRHSGPLRFGALLDQWNRIDVRVNVVTYGTDSVNVSSELANREVQFFVNGKLLQGDSTHLDDGGFLQLAPGQPLRVGPGFVLSNGWLGAAPEAFIDNITMRPITSGPTTCTSDAPCLESGRVCVSGTCKDPACARPNAPCGVCGPCGAGTPCTSQAECDPGLVCTNGTCGVPSTSSCSSDAECPSGYVCGTNNGGCFGRARSTRSCWPAACEDGVSASECGQADSPCGQNCACVTPCDADDPASTCPGNEQCKREFGGLFRSAARDVCVDVACPSNDPNLCGAEDKLCGWQCFVPSDCSTATCEAPGDGAGNDCPAVCDDGEPCTADRQCQFGSVCLSQSNGTRLCRPESCVTQALRPPLCGTSDATCDPQCPASCIDRECGVDPLSGAACGACPAGEYCNGAGQCETSTSDPPPTVPDPTTGAPVPVPELPAVPASGVGALAGSFSVSDRGSPQYTVPIEVPPGRAGVEPAISLQYNGSRQNGDLGMGWHLDGLSQVTRCPKIHALDGYAAPIQGDQSDLFCIDGKRLVAVPAVDGNVAGPYGADGTEYRTMIDSFSKIISHNEVGDVTQGPDYFEVYTKDGRILIFGRTPDSVSTDLNGTRHAWLLSRIQDRATNTVLFTYESFVSQAFGTGASVRTMHVRPSVITYTGHGDTPGNREVRFTYEVRPDTTLAFFQGGAGSVSSERLRRITTYVKGQPVKNYSIRYRDNGRSQIENISECAGADDTSCKRPTKFEYNAEVGFELSTSPEDLNLGEQLDINGDGLPDFVVTTIDHPGVPVDKTKKAIKLVADITATALSYVPATQAVSLFYSAASPAIWNLGHLPGARNTNELFISTGQRCPLNDPDCTAGPVRSLGAIPNSPFLRGDATHVFDFNRDGKDDVAMLYFREQGAGPTMVLQLSGGDGTFSNYSAQPIPIIENVSPFFGDQARAAPMVFDVDGDGLEDLLTCGDRQTLELRLRLGPTLNTPDADFGPAIQLRPENPQFDRRPILPCGNEASPYNIFDLDGDGTLDLLARDDFDDTGDYAEFGKWRVLRFSRASDGTATLEWKPVRFEDWGSAGGGSALGDRLVLGDFNGDGLLDVSRTEGSQMRIWLNTGNASFLAKDLSRPVFGDMTFEASALLDYNGDGRTDILEGYRFGNNASPCGITHRPVLLSPDSTASALTQGEPAGMTWLREDPGNGTVCAQGADFTAAGDLDGDGNIDLFASNSVLYGSGLHHALLSRVEDGLGNVIQVRYDEPGAYQADCQAVTWPEACMPKVTGLVSSYSEGFVPLPNTPVTVERTYQQQYFNARKSVTGHGWLGFDKRIETRLGSRQTVDGSSVPVSRTITTEFWPVARYTLDGQPAVSPATPGQRYIYPLAGMPKTVTLDQDVGAASEIRQGGAVRRTVIENDWRVGLSASNLPYPRIRHRSTRAFDLPEQSSAIDSSLLITEYVEDFRYEDGGYGNVTHHYEDFIPYPEGAYEQRSTVSVYAVDPTSWLISNPSTTFVESTRRTTLELASAYESQTQRWDFGYDPRGLLTSIFRGFLGNDDQQHDTTYLRNHVGNTYQIIESVSTTRVRRVTGIGYDSDDIFPLTITDPLGRVTQVRFDERWGTNTTVIDPNHIVAQQGYDDLGLLAEQSGPDGKTIYTYSPEFLAVSTYGSTLPPRGMIYPRVRVAIERQGTAGTRSGGAVAELDYRGRIVRTSSEGFGGTDVIAEQVYDSLGRMIARTLPHTEASDAPFSFLSYDGLNRLTHVGHYEQTLDNGTVVETQRSGMTREYASRVSLSSGFRHWINGVDCGTSYLSESECVADIIRTTDETGRQSVVATDHRGLVMRSIDGEHVSTTSRSSNYFYGAFNRLIQARDNGGNATSFEYDPYGRQIGVTTPNAGVRSYTYNGYDELTTSLDAKSQLRTYSYDDLGRLTCIFEGTGAPPAVCTPGAPATTVWQYDNGPNALGRLSAMISPGTAENPGGQRIGYTYEAVTAQNRGLLARMDYSIDGVDYPIAYNYDDLGRIATVEYPDLGNGPTVRLKYGYDNSGVQNKAERVEVGSLNTDPLWLLDEMFEGHLVQKETLGNGSTTHYAYDGARRWLEGIQTTLGTTSIQDIGYTHYENGLVESRTDRIDISQIRQRHFDYDALNRLSASTDRNIDNEVTDLSLYRYDHLGRITLRDTSPIAYATLTRHQIANVDSNNNYAYDLNGNVEERNGPKVPGGIQEIHYTPFDLPSSITTGVGQSASTTRFEYSADEQRLVRRDPEKFRHFVPGLYERVALSVGITLEERFRLYAGGREVAQLVRKPGQPDQIQYFHQDHLGTIDTVSFENGTSVRQEFDSFGAPIDPPSPELTRAGFTGQAHDRDLELIDYGGRIYDPLAAQFMQPDPIMQAPYFSQGLNPYAYVLNDPINHIDPSGFEWTLLGDYYPDTLPWWSSGGSSGGSSALGSAGAGIGAGSVASVAGGVAGGVNVVNDVIDLASSAKWEVAPAKFTATPSAQSHRAQGATQPGPDAASQNKGGILPDAGDDPLGLSLFAPGRGALACNGGGDVCLEILRRQQADIVRQNIEAVSEGEWALFWAYSGGQAVRLARWLWAARAMQALRQQYVSAVTALAGRVPGMRQAGMTSEQIARTLHAERRALGVKFKDLTPPDKLAEIHARNLKRYGDKLGPSVDWLRNAGKSWDDIIESATRTGGKDLGL